MRIKGWWIGDLKCAMPTACLAAGMVLLAAPARIEAQQQSQAPQPARDPHSLEEQTAQRQGRGFLQYLDRDRYTDSYSYTAELLRSKASREQFVQQTRKMRAGLGASLSRKLLDASYTTSLQDVPPGEYVVLQYKTDFANRKGVVETVTTTYENGYWRVSGYFLK